MSLLIGDDYPEAVEPHGRENPVPAQGLRDGPAPGGKRRGWARWPGRRPRSMLIQDAPDPAGDGPEYGAGEIDDGGPPYPGNGFFPDPGLGTDGYPQDGYPPTVIPRTVIPGTVIPRTLILTTLLPRFVIQRTVLPATVIHDLVTPIPGITGPPRPALAPTVIQCPSTTTLLIPE